MWPACGRAVLRAPLASTFNPMQQSSMLSLRSIWDGANAKQANGDFSASFYDNTVQEYAQQPVEQLSLRQMLEFGRSVRYERDKVLTSARYVQRELPKRLARRLLDLQFLPHIVVTNPHIKRVYCAYHHSFNVLRGVPPIATWEENAEFSELLRRLVDEHASMLDALASGLRECSSKPLVGGQLRLDAFLDSMLRSRISRRVIAEQHLNLQLNNPGYVGCFHLDLGLAEAAEHASQRVRQVCHETYGAAPEVRVTGDVRAAIAYIPAHLDYMLYELLKNSVRAVVEKHRSAARLPPVQVHLCEGEGYVTIRVSDQGGGIPGSDLARVWQYGYTTTAAATTGRQDGSSNGSGQEGLGQSFGSTWSEVAKYSAGAARYRMAGLGFGLPLSRLYARYFGGGLRLVSMPGYGVDAFLHLRRLEGYDWQEHHAERPAAAGSVGDMGEDEHEAAAAAAAAAEQQHVAGIM